MERLLSGETVSPDREVTLERCCRQLVVLGKKQGGYLTYDNVESAFRTTKCEVSIETVSWVYKRLAAEGVQIVDQIPHASYTQAEPPSEHWEFVEDRSRRQYMADKGARKRARPGGRVDQASQESVKCPEEVIDTLLLHAEQGWVSAHDIFAAIRECVLSQVEARQLVEYLGSKGIDLVGDEDEVMEELLRLRFGFDGDDPQALGEMALYFGVTCERIRRLDIERSRGRDIATTVRGVLVS